MPSDASVTRLIVGSDGRDRSDDALTLGRGLADILGAELIVAAAVGFEPSRSPVQYNQARAEFFANTFARAAAVLAGTSFQPVELQDTPAHGLQRLAESAGAGMLVVGSSHRGAVGRIYPGSVAERLLHGSPCPVAIAPTGYAKRDGHISSVAVGIDGRQRHGPALDFAIDLARHTSGRLTLIRVGPDAHWGAMSPPPLEEIDDANRAALAKLWRDLPEDVESDSHYYVGDAGEQLVLHGAEHNLLVLGSRGYGPLRSVLLGGATSYVVRNAATPVIVVPRPAEVRDGVEADADVAAMA